MPPKEIDETKLCEYDKEHLAAYKKMVTAEQVLVLAKKKPDGFRQPSHADIDDARQVVQEYRRDKSAAFLEAYKKAIVFYGVEIKAHFDMLPNGLVKPSLTVQDYDIHKDLAGVKPWSEALEENLATRTNCTHELNEDETACTACGLNPENWGADRQGVTEAYMAKQREKIQAQKAKELEEAGKKKAE